MGFLDISLSDGPDNVQTQSEVLILEHAKDARDLLWGCSFK